MSIHFGHDIYYDKHKILTPEHKHYNVVFDVNLMKADIIKKSDSSLRVTRVRDGKYSLHQNDYGKSPVPGPDFIRNRRRGYMLFKCPEMVNINISVFIVVCVIRSTPKSGKWGYIIGNDDGGYDKFIGYKSNTSNQLSYGGGWPAKEYNCTIQSGVNILDKHLISCHWLMVGSCLYINGMKSPDSDFTANHKRIGETYGSIFFNERFTDATSSASLPFVGKVYDIKIISGFLEQDDIKDINSNIMKDHEIL